MSATTPPTPPRNGHAPAAQPSRPSAVPTHPLSRADVEKRYRELVDRADSLMVPADMLSNAWSAGELTDRGRDLAARIAARETELAATTHSPPAGDLVSAPYGRLLATPAQVRAIFSIARDQHNLDDPEVDERCQSLFGASPAELTRSQASDFITSLKGGAR